MPDGAKPPAPVKMSTMLSAQLVEYLSSRKLLVSRRAQQLLVEHNNIAAVAPLRKVVETGENPLGRIHALWTLDGMHRLDAAHIRIALADADPRVRAQAIRLAEPILYSTDRDQLLTDVLKLAGDSQPNVRLQFALTVSGVGIAQTDAAIAQVLTADTHNQFVRDAAVSGMRSRELSFIQRFSNDPAWANATAGRAELIETLARCVVTEASAKRVAPMLDVIANAKSPIWQREAMVMGANAAGKAKFSRRSLMLPAEPTKLTSLNKPPRGTKQLMSFIVWPGKPGYVPPPPPKPLNADQQARLTMGAELYTKTCIQCHKADGMGQEGLAPPLVNSDFVLGPDRRFASIVLNGLHGAITVDGRRYNLDMPSWAALNDDQISSVLTYVRRSWDHGGDLIDPPLVKELRQQNAGHDAFNERELMKMK